MLLLCAVCSLMSTFCAYSMEKIVNVAFKIDDNNKIRLFVTPTKKFTKEDRLNLTLAPKTIENFHRALESANFTAAEKLLEDNIWLATMPRAFTTNQVPLITLLATMIKVRPDEREQKKYINLATQIICYNLMINKHYELNSNNVQELTRYVDALFSKDSSQSRLLYKILENHSILVAWPSENREDLQSIQDAFSSCKPFKLLKFLADYPEWIEQIYGNDNSIFMLAIKNFCGWGVEKFFLHCCLQQNPTFLFNKNKDEDVYDAIGKFDELTQMKLFDAIREFFSKSVSSEVKENFCEQIKMERYLEALTLIKKNPGLFYAKFKKNRGLNFYLDKLENKQLKEEIRSELISVRKWETVFKKPKKNIVDWLFRKQSQDSIKNDGTHIRRSSITDLNSQKRLSKSSKKLSKKNIKYQESNFTASFTFGEKKDN